MTKDQLENKHFDVYLEYSALADCRHIEHTKVSIEYAISMLEELKDGYQFMSADGVSGIPRKSIISKITELKSLAHETASNK